MVSNPREIHRKWNIFFSCIFILNHLLHSPATSLSLENSDTASSPAFHNGSLKPVGSICCCHCYLWVVPDPPRSQALPLRSQKCDWQVRFVQQGAPFIHSEGRGCSEMWCNVIKSRAYQHRHSNIGCPSCPHFTPYFPLFLLRRPLTTILMLVTTAVLFQFMVTSWQLFIL